jgi:hypothetical protein
VAAPDMGCVKPGDCHLGRRRPSKGLEGPSAAIDTRRSLEWNFRTFSAARCSRGLRRLFPLTPLCQAHHQLFQLLTVLADKTDRGQILRALELLGLEIAAQAGSVLWQISRTCMIALADSVAEQACSVMRISAQTVLRLCANRE